MDYPVIKNQELVGKNKEGKERHIRERVIARETRDYIKILQKNIIIITIPHYGTEKNLRNIMHKVVKIM